MLYSLVHPLSRSRRGGFYFIAWELERIDECLVDPVSSELSVYEALSVSPRTMVFQGSWIFSLLVGKTQRGLHGDLWIKRTDPLHPCLGDLVVVGFYFNGESQWEWKHMSATYFRLKNSQQRVAVDSENFKRLDCALDWQLQEEIKIQEQRNKQREENIPKNTKKQNLREKR